LTKTPLSKHSKTNCVWQILEKYQHIQNLASAVSSFSFFVTCDSFQLTFRPWQCSTCTEYPLSWGGQLVVPADLVVSWCLVLLLLKRHKGGRGVYLQPFITMTCNTDCHDMDLRSELLMICCCFLSLQIKVKMVTSDDNQVNKLLHHACNALDMIWWPVRRFSAKHVSCPPLTKTFMLTQTTDIMIEGDIEEITRFSKVTYCANSFIFLKQG
jgi:hypothetical protein